MVVLVITRVFSVLMTQDHSLPTPHHGFTFSLVGSIRCPDFAHEYLTEDSNIGVLQTKETTRNVTLIVYPRLFVEVCYVGLYATIYDHVGFRFGKNSRSSILQMKILRTREVVACSGSQRVSCKRSRSQEPYLRARMYIPAAPRAALPLPMMPLLCCWSPTAPQRPPTLLEVKAHLAGHIKPMLIFTPFRFFLIMLLPP